MDFKLFIKLLNPSEDDAKADIQMRWDEIDDGNIQLRRHIGDPAKKSEAESDQLQSNCRDKQRLLAPGSLPEFLVFQMNNARFGHDGEKCSYRCGKEENDYFEDRWIDLMDKGGITLLELYLQDDSTKRDLDSLLTIVFEITEAGKPIVT